MKTIWKFPLEITDFQTVSIPEGGNILSAQCQGVKLFIWVLVDKDRPKRERLIEIIGTGHPISDEERTYISTAIMNGGALVWHIFER